MINLVDLEKYVRSRAGGRERDLSVWLRPTPKKPPRAGKSTFGQTNGLHPLVERRMYDRMICKKSEEKENENESWQKLAMHSRKHHRSIISMHACWTKSNRPCFCRYNLGRYWPFCISFSIREAPPSSTLSLSTFLKFVVICYLTQVLAPWNLRLLLSVI